MKTVLQNYHQKLRKHLRDDKDLSREDKELLKIIISEIDMLIYDEGKQIEAAYKLGFKKGYKEALEDVKYERPLTL